VQYAKEAQAAEFGHHHVEDDNIGQTAPRQDEGKLRVGGSEHLKSSFLEGVFQKFDDVRFVVHEEDFSVGGLFHCGASVLQKGVMREGKVAGKHKRIRLAKSPLRNISAIQP
jgi:hypothetical protein